MLCRSPRAVSRSRPLRVLSPFLLGVLLALSGCIRTEHTRAVGANDEISVFMNVSGSDAEVLKGRLRAIYGYPMDVVGMERAFRLDVEPFERFKVHRFVKNQIFAVDLSRRDRLAKKAEGWIEALAPDRLRTREPFRLLLRDHWASGQTTAILAAWSPEGILGLLAPADSSVIRSAYEASVARGLTKTLFALGEDEALSSSLARDFGWTIRLLPGFEATADPQGKTVILSADNPGRMILVHWMDTTVPLTAAAWSPIIKDVLYRYNDGDFVEPSHTRIFPTTFQGSPGLKWAGVWQNDKLVIGGPFRALALHREGRSYLLIGIVFAPGQRKVYVLRQLEGLFETFEVLL